MRCKLASGLGIAWEFLKKRRDPGDTQGLQGDDGGVLWDFVGIGLSNWVGQ